jgi:hypothetical protein
MATPQSIAGGKGIPGGGTCSGETLRFKPGMAQTLMIHNSLPL